MRMTELWQRPKVERNSITTRFFQLKRKEAEGKYRGAQKPSGAPAVGGAGAAGRLRDAKVSAAAPAEANAFARRAAGPTTSPAASRMWEALDAQQTRFIRGRTFYQNGPLWVDALVQSRPDVRRIQVQFDSDAYYALLADHPEAVQWLSLGRNVQLLLDDVVYEVGE